MFYQSCHHRAEEAFFKEISPIGERIFLLFDKRKEQIFEYHSFFFSQYALIAQEEEVSV